MSTIFFTFVISIFSSVKSVNSFSRDISLSQFSDSNCHLISYFQYQILINFVTFCPMTSTTANPKHNVSETVKRQFIVWIYAFSTGSPVQSTFYTNRDLFIFYIKKNYSKKALIVVGRLSLSADRKKMNDYMVF